MEDFFSSFYEDFIRASGQVGELLGINGMPIDVMGITSSLMLYGKAAFVILGVGIILYIASLFIF